jgi:hypothetical protein
MAVEQAGQVSRQPGAAPRVDEARADQRDVRGLSAHRRGELRHVCLQLRRPAWIAAVVELVGRLERGDRIAHERDGLCHRRLGIPADLAHERGANAGIAHSREPLDESRPLVGHAFAHVRDAELADARDQLGLPGVGGVGVDEVDDDADGVDEGVGWERARRERRRPEWRTAGLAPGVDQQVDGEEHE